MSMDIIENDHMEEETPIELSEIKVKFRNYVPKDDNLKYFCTEELPEDYTSLLQAKYSELLEKYEEEDLINLTPHRSNWDIKRDLASKLEKIDLQTKKAIALLLKENVSKQK